MPRAKEIFPRVILGARAVGSSALLYKFDVFPTVHHSIGYFLEATLMHTSI